MKHDGIKDYLTNEYIRGDHFFVRNKRTDGI